MKLKLNKKKLIILSKDAKALPDDLTPQIGGAGRGRTAGCPTQGGCHTKTKDWVTG